MIRPVDVHAVHHVRRGRRERSRPVGSGLAVPDGRRHSRSRRVQRDGDEHCERPRRLARDSSPSWARQAIHLPRSLAEDRMQRRFPVHWTDDRFLMLSTVIQCRPVRAPAGGRSRENRFGRETGLRKSILACVAVALVVGATSATAATLVTGKQIKNGTITAADIKRGTINASRLTTPCAGSSTASALRAARPAPGAKGDSGSKGDKATRATRAKRPPRHRRQLGRHQPQHDPLARGRAALPSVRRRRVGDGSLNIAVADGTREGRLRQRGRLRRRRARRSTAVGFHVVLHRREHRAPARTTCRASCSRSIRTSAAVALELLVADVFTPRTSPRTRGAATSTPRRPASGTHRRRVRCHAAASLNGARCTLAAMMAYLDDGGVGAGDHLRRRSARAVTSSSTGAVDGSASTAPSSTSRRTGSSSGGRSRS